MTRTRQDLQMLQALPLDLKISMTKARIRQWVNEFGEEGVYISFSGGKDSTVLLHLVREMYSRVPAVFVDTGLEYPEIRDFVKTFDNVTWLRPKMNFRQVIEKYGYPFIGKEVSQDVYEAKRNRPDARVRQKFDPESQYNKRYKGIYCRERWSFFLDDDAPNISHMCCHVMKKAPSKDYEKMTKKVPFIGMMAEESQARRRKWIEEGCNSFNSKRPTSNPMSFWTEQDVLYYIHKYGIQIASVYGEVVADTEVEGQMDFSEYGFDISGQTFKTTGVKRTGCMFCGYGCHHDACPSRFERMKVTHPKQYNYIMKPWDEGGLGYKEVIDWINEHGNLNIRY